MAWTVLRTVTDSVSFVTAADHNETKANFDIVGGTDGATKTGNWYVTGNVGIGTTSPNANLEIYHSGVATYGTAIQLKTTGGTDGPRLAFEMYNAGTPKRWNVGIRNSATVFGIFEDGYHGAFGTERVTVLAGGNVGIGTTSPLAKLSVGAGSLTDANLLIQVSTQGASTEAYFAANKNGAYGLLVGYDQGNLVTGAVIRQATTDPLYFIVNNNTTAITITSAGYVGIGVAPSYSLHLAADSAAKPTSNTWTISSDARVKEIIGSYTRGVADIMALEPKRYRLNGAFGSVDDGRVHVSVIAQEAQETWPEMIGTYEHTDKDEDGVETVTELLNLNTNDLQWALVNAIKELSQRVEALEA